MDKKRLEKLAYRYGKRAENAYRNYQDSGISRYDNEYRNYSELADIISMALNAVDEHNAYISMRADLSNLAMKAETALRHPDEVTSALNNTIGMAEAYGAYRRTYDK